MIDGFIYLDRKVRSEKEWNRLYELAKRDNHGVFAPTHPIRKGKELVGYFSIGAPGVPMVLGHISTEDVMPRESFTLINAVENHVYLNGATGVCFPMPKESPFYPIMPSMGYTNVGNYDLFMKLML